MYSPGLDPYKYGKQMVKKTFQKIDVDRADKQANSARKIALLIAKRGLITLVKEDPDNFYYLAGKFSLKEIHSGKNKYDFKTQKYPLKKVLYLAALTRGVGLDIKKFKNSVMKSLMR